MRFGSATLLVTPLLVTAGCHVMTVEDWGKLQTETQTIAKPKAEMVEMEVAMAAGELRLEGGASNLLDARFTYSVARFKPEVRYEESSFRGRLSVRQTGPRTGSNVKNEWELKVADDVRLDLRVKLGAGESTLKLGSLTLRSAEVDIGAGSVEVDLRGNTKSSCDVRVRGGVGEATIYLPKEAGVIAYAKGALGERQVRGLRRDGDAWVNDAYGKSKTTIRLDVKGGIGAINILAE